MTGSQATPELGHPTIREDLRARYLEALSVDAESVSAETLHALHRAHVQRFAHDTVWKARGRIPELTPTGLVEALLAGEGGGCLHLNGGFCWLLQSLGFTAQLHGGRVRRAFDPVPDPRLDVHPIVVVEVEGRRWYADVGMGNGLFEPIPLEEGRVLQSGGFQYALERSEEAGLAWRFVHDRRVMAVRTVEIEEQSRDVGAMSATYLHDAHDPNAVGRRQITANRRLPDGIVSLTGGTLIRRGEGAQDLRHLHSPEEWEQVLREEFLLALPEWSRSERDRLWAWAIRTD